MLDQENETDNYVLVEESSPLISYTIPISWCQLYQSVTKTLADKPNASVKRYNLEMLQSIVEANVLIIPAKNQFPRNITRQKIIKVLNQNQSETGGLTGVLDIKFNARVMLIVNIDLQGRLINWQLGTHTYLKCIQTDSQRNISKIYKKFNDSKAGLKRINSDAFVKRNSWVPIEKTEGLCQN